MEHYQVKGLHHVGYPTTDMDATIQFYESLGGKIAFQKMDQEENRPIRVTLIEFHGVTIECYERKSTPKCIGAIDHLAFDVENVEEMYRVCKQKGYRLMEDCADQIGCSTYWPRNTHWFIVYGPNEEKIEFCQMD